MVSQAAKSRVAGSCERSIRAPLSTQASDSVEIAMIPSLEDIGGGSSTWRSMLTLMRSRARFTPRRRRVPHPEGGKSSTQVCATHFAAGVPGHGILPARRWRRTGVSAPPWGFAIGHLVRVYRDLVSPATPPDSGERSVLRSWEVCASHPAGGAPTGCVDRRGGALRRTRTSAVHPRVTPELGVYGK